MSIIQEALKKAQGTKRVATPVPPPLAPRDLPYLAPRPAARRSFPYAIFFTAVVIMIAVAALAYVASRHQRSVKVLPSKIAKPVSPVPAATAPVVNREAGAEKSTAGPTGPVVEDSKPTPTQAQTAVPQQKDLVLSGIMHLDGGSQAIINDTTVMEGDSVDDAIVTTITDNKVVLKRRDAEIVLRLK